MKSSNSTNSATSAAPSATRASSSNTKSKKTKNKSRPSAKSAAVNRSNKKPLRPRRAWANSSTVCVPAPISPPFDQPCNPLRRQPLPPPNPCLPLPALNRQHLRQCPNQPESQERKSTILRLPRPPHPGRVKTQPPNRASRPPSKFKTQTLKIPQVRRLP